MLVRSLELDSFRAWESVSAAFDARATALIGPNASGKTSLLEALWFAASLSSHRTQTDAVMVRDGCSSAVVRVEVTKGGHSESIELEIVTKGRARARLGGANVSRRRDVLGTLRAAIFAPEREAVIRGEPGDRRRFVDEVLVQLHPRFHAVIKDYDRALRQRNALLREHAQGRRSLDGLDVWDEALVGPGAELAAGRARAIASLAPHARTAFDAVGGQASFAVAYEPKVPWPEAGAREDVGAWRERFKARLAERQELEIIRGVTLVGPHRDDALVQISGLPARTHSSHGEGWLAAVALVLGAHAAIAASTGTEPVLLLDDPFTLLDPERRERLAGALPAKAQVIATAADPAEIPGSLGATNVDVRELHGASA